MRKDHGKKSILTAQRFQIDGTGDGRHIRSIDLALTGVADTGDTVALDELSSLTLNHEGESPLDAIVNNVRPYEIIALNRYLGRSINFASAEAGAVNAEYCIPFDVLPLLKPGLHNTFLLDDDHYFTLEIDASHDDFASGDICLDEEYFLEGNMAYYVQYRRIARDLSDETPFKFPKNTVYMVIAPGSSSSPSEIRLFQNDRRVDKGSFADLLEATRRKQGLELAPTHIVLDITSKGANRAAMANRLSMEHTGGSGTMEIMFVTVNFADDMTEKAAAATLVTESLFRSQLGKETTPSVIKKLTSKVDTPKKLTPAQQAIIKSSRTLAI